MGSRTKQLVGKPNKMLKVWLVVDKDRQMGMKLQDKY